MTQTTLFGETTATVRDAYIPVQRIGLIRESKIRNYGKIGGSSDAMKAFKTYYEKMNFAQEVFVIATLDTKNQITGIVEITRGTLDASLVHPREVFAPALEAAASSIILAHNHLSGDPTPSKEDRQVTKRLEECGRILGIDVLDHIVVGDTCVSLREL
jgi:DNA repair protein RadC